MTPDSVPGLTGPIHAHLQNLQLLYVGIASRPSSNLRQRLMTHNQGTSRRSTQRLSLAALLADQYSWSAAVISGRPALATEFEAQLSTFMARYLRVSWLSHDDPESAEDAIIERLASAQP
ncbi:GIY-YIG nuclease family protein [Pseudarthrobacter raffinosi]|uniref:GIY-YIG nuclease family protein n=1 Tax=Pseudarthrobacter raffinosi TaxID=2953651 RepID=UPI0035ABD007